MLVYKLLAVASWVSDKGEMFVKLLRNKKISPKPARTKKCSLKLGTSTERVKRSMIIICENYAEVYHILFSPTNSKLLCYNLLYSNTVIYYNT